MKVLGICASPRKHGNTSAMLDEALRGSEYSGAHLEKIFVSDLKILPCAGCCMCYKNGRCVISDDMQAIYRKFGEADVVIIASPIYFGSITGALKVMVDRFQSLWAGKYLLGRRLRASHGEGMAIFTQSSGRKESFDNAEAILRNLFATLDFKFMGSRRFTGEENNAKTAGR